MAKSLPTIIVATALTLLGACSSGNDNSAPVPRRRAYPRIEIPDSTFTIVDNAPNSLQINAGANVDNTSDNSGKWITVSYPGLNAKIYYTFTPVDNSTIDAVVDNRIERINLNLSGHKAEFIPVDTREGFTGQIVVDRFGGTTPVQFIVTDRGSVVVSGAAFLPAASEATTDSLSPVVDMLRRDIIHSIKTLKR